MSWVKIPNSPGVTRTENVSGPKALIKDLEPAAWLAWVEREVANGSSASQ